MQRSTVDFSNMIHFTGRAYDGKPFDQQFIPYETIWQKYQRESMNADVLAMSPTRRHNVLDFIQTLGDNEVREGFICWFRKLHSAADRIGPCRHCGGRIILCILECPLCQCDYPFCRVSPFSTIRIQRLHIVCVQFGLLPGLVFVSEFLGTSP